MVGWLSGWGGPRLKLSLDSSVVDSTLTWFPVCIQLSASAGKNSFNTRRVLTDLGATGSRKIAVTEDNGTTELPVEVVGWDTTSCELHTSKTGWEISDAVDEVLYLYWDSAHADNANVNVVGSASGEAVWDTNYVLVDHMDDNPNTSSTMDSTSYDNDGAKLGANEPNYTTGKMWGAQVFDGVDDIITITDDADLDVGNNLTIDLWVKFNSVAAGRQTFYGCNNEVSGFQFEVEFGVGTTTVHVIIAGVFVASIFFATGFTTGVWYSLGYTRNGIGLGTSTMFKNGVSVALSGEAGDGFVDPTNDRKIGRRAAASQLLNGVLDEFKLSKITRSADWVKTSFYNEDDNFISYEFDSGSSGESLYFYPSMWRHYYKSVKPDPTPPKPDSSKVDWSLRAVQKASLSRRVKRVLGSNKK